jgi:DNA repair exonuclease SbcCD ATPase subunit
MSQIESSNESLTQKASQITASASESTKKAQADKKAAADEASRLKKEISKSNKEMAKLKEDAAKHVQGKANLLKAKDEEIKAKDEEIKAKDEEIKAKDEEIKAKDKEVDAKVQSQIDAQIEIKLKKTIESHQLQLDFANKRKKVELDQSKKEKEEMQKQLNEAQEQIKAKDQAISDAASDKGADKIELDKAKQETQEIESRLKSSEEKAAAEANSFKAEIAALVSKIEKMEEEAQAAQRAPPPLLLSVSNAARANVNDTLQNAESSFQFEAEETPRHDPVIKKPVKAAVRRTSKPLSFKKVNTTDSSKVAPRAEKLAPSGNEGRVAGSSLAPIKRAAAIDVEIPDKAGSSKKRRGGDAGPVKAKKQKQTKNAMIKSTASSISSIINNQKPSAARVPSPTKSSGSLSSQASSDLDIFS